MGREVEESPEAVSTREEGANASKKVKVGNAEGEQILYLFEEEDDAIRFSIQLEEDDYPEMHVIEVDEELMLKTCDLHDYKYTVITKNDIVIPPLENDRISGY